MIDSSARVDLVAIVGCVVLASTMRLAAQGSEQSNSQALQALQARPRVTLSVAGGSRIVTGPLDIYVELVNLSENDLSIHQIDLELPGEVEAARGMKVEQSLKFSEPMMQPGHQRLVHFRLPAEGANPWRMLTNPQLLAFAPGDYRYRVVVMFKVPPSKETAVSESGTLTMAPPLASLLWGGVLGSILLAMFVGAYRATRKPRSRRRRQFVETVLLAAAGAICAVIALILLRRLQGVELPVNITIADFYGGVVIGLFSFKIGDWLYSQLLALNESPDGSDPRSELT